MLINHYVASSPATGSTYGKWQRILFILQHFPIKYAFAHVGNFCLHLVVDFEEVSSLGQWGKIFLRQDALSEPGLLLITYNTFSNLFLFRPQFSHSAGGSHLAKLLLMWLHFPGILHVPPSYFLPGHVSPLEFACIFIISLLYISKINSKY